MIDPLPSRLKSYDFRPALALAVEDRLAVCVERVRQMQTGSAYAAFSDLPTVPARGATEAELAGLERKLDVTLPGEYRAFLSRWRYLDIGTGLKIWGLDHDGVSIGWPWVSDSHPVAGKFLVFGDYWNYADGDQLMFKLDSPEIPVVAYLHEEDPPVAEFFAPSFSLALWRMLH